MQHPSHTVHLRRCRHAYRTSRNTHAPFTYIRLPAGMHCAAPTHPSRTPDYPLPLNHKPTTLNPSRTPDYLPACFMQHPPTHPLQTAAYRTCWHSWHAMHRATPTHPSRTPAYLPACIPYLAQYSRTLHVHPPPSCRHACMAQHPRIRHVREGCVSGLLRSMPLGTR
jgi:hypothetical protein